MSASICLGSASTSNLFERGRTVVDRLAHRLEDFGVGVLRRVLEQLQKRVDELQGVPADEVQFLPQAIEPPSLWRRSA